ncbi:MAG: hypothetical protein QM785_19545 [Pyrinomonadaceae bacterium]
MKFLLILISVLYIPMGVFGQCDNVQKPDSVPLKTLKFSLVTPDEFGLQIKARVPGGSWSQKGSEAAVLTIFVDGIYRNDIILFAGNVFFQYKSLLGRLEQGEHKISVFVNHVRSAENTKRVVISDARVVNLSRSRDPIHQLAIENAPFLYAREKVVDKFSDIPLLTYYEVLPEKNGVIGIRYTTIFTNEDGGTQTAALLARWGRATDIEWVYEVWLRDGKRVSETFQGANHIATAFNGKRIFGDHPAINTVTDNNNFSDAGCSKLRISPMPIRADLTLGSRETVMDENPWTYRIMAEEAMREGRIDPANLGINTIDDLRNYLFVEVYSENNGTALSLQVTTKDGNTSSSDSNDARLQMNRPGFQRIAVRLPAASPIRSIKLTCHRLSNGNDQSSCGASELVRYVRLDHAFFPRTVRPDKNNRRSIRPGESVEWITK